MRKIFWIVFFALIIAVVWLLNGSLKGDNLTFVCPSGNEIAIRYMDYSGSVVRMALSESLIFELERTETVSGARFANLDETVVFWNRDDGATVELDGSILYDSCPLKSDETNT